MHGDSDKIIPFWHGKNLFSIANEPKKLLTIQGGGHNNYRDIMLDQYWIEIKNFINEINKTNRIEKIK